MENEMTKKAAPSSPKTRPKPRPTPKPDSPKPLGLPPVESTPPAPPVKPPKK